VIYDWRMNGKALALSSRMPRIGQAYSAPSDATPRKGVICAPDIAKTAATPSPPASDPPPTAPVAPAH
jgi:soluble lytic murein transglycosylase